MSLYAGIPLESESLIRGQISELGNQQERLRGWVGGIIDGEGNVSFQVGDRGRGRIIQPLIKVSNTNRVLMDRLASILAAEGVAFWRGTEGVKQSHHKPQERIAVVGYKRGKRFLDVFAPYIVSKQPQVAVLQEYIRHRAALPYNQEYGSYEQRLLGVIRRLNRRGILND